MARFDPAYPLAGLRGASYNPRRIHSDAMAALQESLAALGVCKPIIVSGDLIVAGHQRTQAMRALGRNTAFRQGPARFGRRVVVHVLGRHFVARLIRRQVFPGPAAVGVALEGHVRKGHAELLGGALGIAEVAVIVGHGGLSFLLPGALRPGASRRWCLHNDTDRTGCNIIMRRRYDFSGARHNDRPEAKSEGGAS